MTLTARSCETTSSFPGGGGHTIALAVGDGETLRDGLGDAEDVGDAEELTEGDGDADVDALGDGLGLDEAVGVGDAVALLLGDALGEADGSDEGVGLGDGEALDVSDGLGVVDDDDTSSAAISSNATSSAVPDRGEADARGVGSDVALSEGDGLVTTSGEGEGDAEDDGVGVGVALGDADDVLDAEAEGDVVVGVGVALGFTSSASQIGSFKGSRAGAEPTAPTWPTATNVATVDTRRAPAPRARAQREELTGRISPNGKQTRPPNKGRCSVISTLGDPRLSRA